MPSMPESGNSAEPSDAEQSASKRRRISVACNLCRSRKTRCSGDQPCSMCTQLGVACEYQQGTQYDNVVLPQVVVSELQERLKAIEKLVQQTRQGEGQLAQLSALSPVSNPSTRSFEHRSIPDNAKTPTSQNISSWSSRLSRQDEPQSIGTISSEPEGDNAIDGMAITVSEGNQSAFFGPSSNTAFIRQIQNLAQTMTVPSLNDCIMRGTITVTPPVSSGARIDDELMKETNEFILPPQRLLEALIDIFFSHAALFFPYLHEPSFRKTYADLKASHFKSARRPWLALLNMVLAIASKLSRSATNASYRLDTDDVTYYKRSIKLCNEFMFCATNVEMVQCLLLMAWHLQSTQDSTRTWFIHGVVVRAAISLGFHSELATDDFNVIERETRVRVWYGCIALDRILGLSFGRPWAILRTTNLLRRPAPFPTSRTPILDGRDVAPVETLGIHLLNESISLHDITVDIINAFYCDNLGVPQLEASEKIIPQVVSLAGRCEAWWDSVHPSVRWHPPGHDVHDGSRSSAMIDLTKKVIKLDFLNAQLLLYRPVIYLAAKIKPSVEVEEHSVFLKMISICIRKCFHAADLLISMVQELQNASGPFAGSPWLSPYQTFHAALTSFAMMLLTPHLLTAPSDQNFLVLERAVSVLKNLGTGNNKIGLACSQYVQLLLSTLRESASANRIEEPFFRSRQRTPPDIRAVYQDMSGMTNSHLPGSNIAFEGVPDIDLAQFFSQDQIRFFGLNGGDNDSDQQDARGMVQYM